MQILCQRMNFYNLFICNTLEVIRINLEAKKSNKLDINPNYWKFKGDSPWMGIPFEILL